MSSHPTALPDPRAAIPRVGRRGRNVKVLRNVYLVHLVGDLDELLDRLDRRLDRLLDWLVPTLVGRVVEDAVGNAMKKSMVRCVHRNPELAVKILHGLSSGNRIVKDVKGDYHFKVIMGNDEYMVYKYTMEILTEGLFNNEDPKVTAYNFQLFNDEVAMDNVRLLPNPEDTETADKIRCRSLVERVEARIAVNAGMVDRNATTWKKTCAFRQYIDKHKADTNEKRYESVKALLVKHGMDRMVQDDLLRDFTSDSGIIFDIRKKGNRAAHCEDTKEEMFVAAVKRQPKELQPYMEKVRLVGKPRKPHKPRKSRS